MIENKLFKLLCSIPVILVVLYFLPFLGVCLLLFRYYVNKSRSRYYSTPICLLIIGIFLLIPKVISSILKIFKLNNIEIPYIDTIITSDIYLKLLDYSKLLITISIIFLIIEFVFRNIFNNLKNKLSSNIRNYMEQDLKQEYEIRKENDLKMQEKREKSKNTHVVFCPYCGSDNMLTEKIGICKFCRRKIEYKN